MYLHDDTKLNMEKTNGVALWFHKYSFVYPMTHYINPAFQEQAIVSIRAKLIKHIFRIGRRMLLNDGDPTWLSLPSPISWTSVLPCGTFKPFVRGLQGTVEGASDLLSSRLCPQKTSALTFHPLATPHTFLQTEPPHAVMGKVCTTETQESYK